MKYINEYRQEELVQTITKKIHQITKNPWTIMEVCGGQTTSIAKFALMDLLPKEITLIHGPGCPVCVTPINIINHAIEIAKQKDVIFCTFGDMIRVPGDSQDLLSIKAKGANLKIVYSPLDAVKIAQENPDHNVVFFAIGFETTTCANAFALQLADQLKLQNFSMLCAQVLVPPAIEVILSSPHNQVQGFLAAGHVCAVMGYKEYEPIVEKYKVPIVVTGFEPVDILQGILKCIILLESGKPSIENAYNRSVIREGNKQAQNLINKVFEITDQKWRGLGVIPKSGLTIKEKFVYLDALKRFPLNQTEAIKEKTACISDKILTGICKPFECPEFGKNCTPSKPIGALMVSNEGACSAYYRYRKDQK